MPHLVLLGDSIFDNGAYTDGGPDVVSQVRGLLPPGWNATLLAVAGVTTDRVGDQLDRVPRDATHLAPRRSRESLSAWSGAGTRPAW